MESMLLSPENRNSRDLRRLDSEYRKLDSASGGERPMRRKVLVVDDDPYLSTQLGKSLESDELSVDTVSSGQEALASLLATDYSVLITDLRMPGMGGMDLIREVAERRLLVTTIVT